MGRNKKPDLILESLEIEAVAAEGKSIAHAPDGRVVFVEYAVPGDIADVRILSRKKSYMEGRIETLVKPSENRMQPFCEHFGVCGGCKWQNLPYEEQLKAKQKQVYDQLRRIGKVELPEISPILGSQKTTAYRNKLEFGCCNKRWLTREQVASGFKYDNMNGIGFHITGAFDKILPIEKCWLMDDMHNRIRNSIRDYAFENGISFFDLREQHGLLRDVIIRNSNSGEWMVIVQFHYDVEGDEERALGVMQHIADSFPEITALMYVNNQKCNDTIGDQDIIVFKGNDHIFEHMEELRFKVGPKSFYQTNTDQAYHLYCVAREFAQLTGNEVVYDLYTGTGTIANFVARKASKVVGIEYVPEAIEDAKVNSAINGIGNTTFFAGDMKDILTDDFIAGHGKPDVIITDPPRAGMHPDVVKVIMNAAPKRIVYVSCNPATQARDLQLLDPLYKVEKVQPVDMFPHTPHVENVVLLEMKHYKNTETLRY